MYNKSLGALEEFVLLMILVLEESYSVTLSEEYRKQTGKPISIPAMHTVLRQLEKKGFVESKIGGSTKSRGGRSKRIYSITASGYKVIKRVQEERNRLWAMAPDVSFG